MCESARGVFSSTKPDGMVLREAALKVAGRDGSVYCTEHGMWTQVGDKAAVMPAQTRKFSMLLSTSIDRSCNATDCQ